MDIKLIALDIDGTITNQAETVSERNRRAIKQAEEAGVIVTLATGRGVTATRPIWRTLDLHGPSIQYGGALTVDIATERIINLREVAPEIIKEVFAYSEEISINVQIYLNEIVICEKKNPFTEHYVKRHGMKFEVDPDVRNKMYHNVPKMLAIVEHERQQEVFEMYRDRFHGIAQVSRSSPGFIEINELGVTKATALEALCNMHGIARENVAALGDNLLDYDMIKWAGTGGCVADGAEALKEAADLIIPTCDEDGAAYFIEQYVLQ